MPPAVAAWAVPAGIGAIGLIQQAGAARSAQNAANQGLALQQNQVGLQDQALNELMSQYKANVANGVYSAQGNLEAYRNSLDRNQKIVSGNLAGNAAIMGYRPGDTAPLDAMATQANDYKLQEAQGEQNILNAKQQQQMNDLSRLTGSAGVLNAGVQAGTQDYMYGQNMANQQYAGMGGILSSLAPLYMQYANRNPQTNMNVGQVNTATGSGGVPRYQRPVDNV